MKKISILLVTIMVLLSCGETKKSEVKTLDEEKVNQEQVQKNKTQEVVKKQDVMEEKIVNEEKIEENSEEGETTTIKNKKIEEKLPVEGMEMVQEAKNENNLDTFIYTNTEHGFSIEFPQIFETTFVKEKTIGKSQIFSFQFGKRNNKYESELFFIAVTSKTDWQKEKKVYKGSLTMYNDESVIVEKDGNIFHYGHGHDISNGGKKYLDALENEGYTFTNKYSKTQQVDILGYLKDHITF